MVHLRDLQKLGGVLAPSHLQVLSCIIWWYNVDNGFFFYQLSYDLGFFQEMEFARSLRQSKVNIKICQVNLSEK